MHERTLTPHVPYHIHIPTYARRDNLGAERASNRRCDAIRYGSLRSALNLSTAALAHRRRRRRCRCRLSDSAGVWLSSLTHSNISSMSAL